MKLQAFTIISAGLADDHKHESRNYRPDTLGFTDEVLEAVCDKADVGLEVEYDGGTRYMSPVAVCEEYLIPRLLELHLGETNSVSTTLRINGDTHCASLKIGSACGPVKHNVNKRISEVVWNYAWVTESGHLAMFYIGKRKGKSTALRDGKGNVKHIPPKA